MRHVYLVIVILARPLEAQSVVRAAAFALHRVLVVANVFTGSVPPDTARLGRVLHRVEQGFLALVIRAVRLDEVDHVEFVPDVFADVADFEVVPLGVSCRSIIILEYQVVCVFTDAERPPQISRLETTLEH